MPPTRFPCSPGQRQFWVMDRIAPGNPALNIALRWRLQGRVSNADLGRAFTRILSRHPPLRTFIVEEDGEPVQMVEPLVSFHIPDIDLTGFSGEEAFAEAERIAQLEARAAFDLSVPPLIRVTQLRLRADLSIVLLTAHQMVCDGRSVEILAREMGMICSAFQAGRAPVLPELPFSYGEYVERQAQRLPGAAARSDEEFWTRSLQGLRHFELYPDYPRPPLRTSNGNVVSRLLDPDLMQGLQGLSKRSGASLFTTMLTALFTLLHRYSAETDIAVGSQIAGRNTAELEGIVGQFISTLVLRCDLSGDPAFSDLLARVHDRVNEDFKHLSTPLERVIELLKPRRDLSRNALFSVNFIFQSALFADHRHEGFTRADLPSCCAGAMYDLSFSMVERTDGWRLSCEYNTDLFAPDTAGGLLAHFVNLLCAAVADPGQAISSLAMLGEAEKRRLTTGLNPADTDYPRHLTVVGLFAAQVQRSPDATAVICGAHRLSYLELDRASNQLAHELRSRGIGRRSRVGICLDRSSDLVVALLAVLKSGGAYIPLDPAYPSMRLAQIIEDAQPALLLSKQPLRARLADIGATSVLLLDADAALISRQPDSNPDPDLSADPTDLAYIIFTSGSTGRPKGVQVLHRALTNFLWAMRSQPGLGASDTLVAVTTVSFDIAGLELFLPLIVGARLVIAQENETADGEILRQLLLLHQATVLQATPVTWQILLAAGWAPEPKLKMLCGGEALSRTLADQLLQRGGELWNMYGPTETTIWSSVLRVEPGTGPVLIGPPIANTQFHILDPRGQLLPTGVPGELYIGGDGVALGYLNLPQMTLERFVPDHFRDLPGIKDARMYRTGDRVRLRPDGTLEFLGRTDHQIKLRGFRIELGEIESVLLAHPGIAEAVAVAAADASGECAIRAYVVARPRSGTPAEPAEALAGRLKSSLLRALPAYMCPSSIAVLATLPRTPNGKIDRSALPMPQWTPHQSRESGPPASAAEQRLARIWSGVLGIPEVGVDVNFFEVGGHSLLAVRLLVRIEAEFGRKLSLAALFKSPTIAEQALLLARLDDGGDARAFDFRQVLKLQPNGLRPPLIAINNTGIYYALSKRLGPDQPFTSLQLFDPALPSASLPRTLEDIAAAYAQLIRRVQPAGPYALLGWCVAGTLAFEVARQLTAAEQKVTQLILFDTLAPGHLRRLPWSRAVLADYSYRWKLITADWHRLKSGKRWPQALRDFLANRMTVKKLREKLAPRPALTPAADGDSITAGLVQDRSLSPEQYDQWLLQYLEEAAASYEPGPYPGTLTLFRSSGEPAGRFLDPEMGWGAFAADGVEVIVIEGDHFSIFQEPSVSQMARRIESALATGAPQPPS